MELEELLLTSKQLERIIKRVISAFASDWKPDNTKLRFPVEKHEGVYFEVVCVQPFVGLVGGEWKIGFYREGDALPIRAYAGPSLKALLTMVAKPEEKVEQVVQTSAGILKFTNYQLNKLSAYFLAVNEQGLTEKMNVQLKMTTKDGKDVGVRATATPEMALVFRHNKKDIKLPHQTLRILKIC